MEVALNNVDEARSIYKRSYSRRFEAQGTEVGGNTMYPMSCCHGHFSLRVDALVTPDACFTFKK